VFFFFFFGKKKGFFFPLFFFFLIEPRHKMDMVVSFGRLELAKELVFLGLGLEATVTELRRGVDELE